MASYLLGVDNGCTVSKAGLFTLDGKEVAVASAQTEVICTQPRWQERDMEQMWQGTCHQAGRSSGPGGTPGYCLRDLYGPWQWSVSH